ncbi:hypothetical protein [Paraliomyxa miuraensis]|uniref:hypothetical protein n=1 Tax=Paraliomyxa miuraensis TaxID=376150 RepID=UPI0022521E93|nr:hypothetical protein [Paraliomyxa miuraensis]MCX4241966.1 hypothetical protein [Paraliomyxa miuraensis]
MTSRPLHLLIGLAAALSLGPACGIFGIEDEPDITDGDLCSSDDDCITGVCTTASLCSHSACTCPGDACAPGGDEVDACREGWVCVDKDSILDPVVDFFGGDPSERHGYCMPRCDAGCPEHYVCNGELCSPDEYWAYPIPTVVWTGAVAGELSGRNGDTTVEVEEGATITLEGFAESPTQTEITELRWTTVSQAGDYLDHEGSSIEITVPSGGTGYRRVELTAVDARSRSGMLTVVFSACFGAGTSCGYQGSGCCTSCDDATSTCL